MLGLGSIGASVFAKVETHGNYVSLKETLDKDGPSTAYDKPLLEEYTSTLKRMHLIAWIAGALAIVVGLLALQKQKAARVRGPLPVAAMVFGAAGAGLSVLSAPPWV